MVSGVAARKPVGRFPNRVVGARRRFRGNAAGYGIPGRRPRLKKRSGNGGSTFPGQGLSCDPPSAPTSRGLARCMSYLYSLYDALVSINVPSDKARAVVDAMERDMLMQLASKADTESVRLALKADLENVRLSITADVAAVQVEVGNLRSALSTGIDNLRLSNKADLENLRAVTDAKLELLRSSMTIRLGSMLVVCLGLLFTALKLT